MHPVGPADKVLILMTGTAFTTASLKLCFRVMKIDGTPVTCGYQTIVTISKKTHEVTPLPKSLLRYKDTCQESYLSFIDEVHKGGKVLDNIFQDPIRIMVKNNKNLEKPGILEIKSEQNIARKKYVSEPIAIVSMSCVLPGGANSPDEFWENIINGTSGIIDESNAEDLSFFISQKADVTPDKSYTGLKGKIKDFKPLSNDYKYLDQQLLETCLKQLKVKNGDANLERHSVIIGATSDGSEVFDQSELIHDLANQQQSQIGRAHV